MNDSLPEPIKDQTKQNLSPPLKFLPIILGLLSVVLLGETVFLTVMKNKNKNLNEKKQEEAAGVVKEKITPVPTGEIEKQVESSWEGKKTSLIKGKLASFDINEGKMKLILEDNTERIINIDDKTIFMYIETDKVESPSRPEIVDISTFWKDVKIESIISASCYGDGTAAFVTKTVNYKEQD